MQTYDVGDVARILATFTNSAGAGVDPSSVTLQVRPRDWSVASYSTLIYGVNSIAKASAGVYYHDFPVNTPGELMYRWNGLGINAAAEEGMFTVRQRTVG
jgi:hypothetical protein